MATAGRIVLIFLFLTALSKSFAMAGDAASLNVIGFSPDGKVFAFEQYGVEDGSGFPYAEIVMVDTEKDAWLPGTPIRKRVDTDGASLEEARKAVADEARPLLSKWRVGEPGETLFSDPDAANPDGLQRVKISQGFPMNLILEERPVASPECAKFTDRPVKAFTLTEKTFRSSPNVVHRDDSVPASRGCPLAYAVTRLIVHGGGGKPVYAALIRMEKHGFEGPDSRYLAVTF
jgi:predicted secreted protein